MATAIMSSISVKPAAATRARADPIAGRDGVAESEAGIAGARDASGRSRLLHVKQNRVDEFGRCAFTYVPPDKYSDPRSSAMHLCFHALRCCVINLPD
jgi:hypothetical protein